jgi:hypothetical protein
VPDGEVQGEAAVSARPQMPYGFRARSNWGEGDALAEYVIGDLVYVSKSAPAVLSERCAAGLHRVESCFSVGEDARFYYRLCPAEIVGERGRLRVKTDWESVSDRIHVGPDLTDYTLGWVRLFTSAGEIGGAA